MCDFNPRKSRVKVTMVIYHSIFITQAPLVAEIGSKFVLNRDYRGQEKIKTALVINNFYEMEVIA